jgi:hypothetical protein
MKVGDLVRYKYIATDGQRHDHLKTKPALILYVNEEGGTLKVLDSNGQVDWFVTSYSEVISEGG